MPHDEQNNPENGIRQDRLAEQRRRLAEELPDLIRRNQLAREAGEEPTLSGELRRAIHSSKVPLAQIADAAGITSIMLSEFLTGERTLRSDVLDRLAHALGYELRPAS
jgi:transcriptional regulator with XRE-family HTH domain